MIINVYITEGRDTGVCIVLFLGMGHKYFV